MKKSAFCSLLFALVLALAVAVGAQEQPPPAAKPGQMKNLAPVSKDVLKITLPRPAEADLSNGVHLMVLEDHRVPSISFEIMMMGAIYLGPQDEAVVTALIAALHDASPMVRVRILKTLAEIAPGSQSALAAVRAALQDDDAEVRQTAGDAKRRAHSPLDHLLQRVGIARPADPLDRRREAGLAAE